MRAPREGSLGVVGIGEMGFAIASHLLDAGYGVTAYDEREEALRSFRAAGGKTTESAYDLALNESAIHLVVVNADQVKNVLEGDEGVFEGFADSAHEKAFVLIHSTIEPRVVEGLAERAPDGITIMDAAVSGGAPRAREGDLSLMVGGTDETVTAYEDVLDEMSRTIFHCGPVGMGVAVKLLNNAVLNAQAVATIEAVNIGRELGLSEEHLIHVFGQSSANNSVVERWEYWTRERLKTHPQGPLVGVGKSRKDMSQMLHMANAADLEAPMAALVSQLAPAMRRELGEQVLDNRD